MRFDDEYKKCVVLIGTAPVGKAGGEIKPWGTGFLVSNSDDDNVYLITAAHVISRNSRDPIDIRFNKHGGGADVLHVDEPEWSFHPTDDTVDVAVLPILVPVWADYKCISRSPNLTEKDRFHRKGIGAGNRTYTVGLFKFLHGDRRNQPFVYSGHIGLVPEDQRIPVDGWFDQHGDRVLVEAYLVEGEPLDGASGSPVFVRRTLAPRLIPPSTKLKFWPEGSIWLLGILSDVFKGRPGQDYASHDTFMIPRGVNVVVPARKIFEVLDHPELERRRQEKRDRDDQKFRPAKAATRSMEHVTEPEAYDHREGFNRPLTAAVKRRKSTDQT